MPRPPFEMPKEWLARETRQAELLQLPAGLRRTVAQVRTVLSGGSHALLFCNQGLHFTLTCPLMAMGRLLLVHSILHINYVGDTDHLPPVYCLVL